jgi:hypothetical protein
MPRIKTMFDVSQLHKDSMLLGKQVASDLHKEKKERTDDEFIVCPRTTAYSLEKIIKRTSMSVVEKGPGKSELG